MQHQNSSFHSSFSLSSICRIVYSRRDAAIHRNNDLSDFFKDLEFLAYESLSSREETSTKREISRGSSRSAPNMRAWDSQILLYDPRSQHVFARDRLEITRVKILMLEINETHEILSNLWN